MMENPKIDFDMIRSKIENIAIKYVAQSGVYLDLVEERHARLVMPVNDLHLNHVGIVYAGSMFVIAELMTAVLLYCTYGTDKYVPIAVKDEIEFLKPTKKDLVVDVSLTEEEAAEMIKPVEERGKGRITMVLPVTDIDGLDVARMTATVYLMPAGQKIG